MSTSETQFLTAVLFTSFPDMAYSAMWEEPPILIVSPLASHSRAKLSTALRTAEFPFSSWIAIGLPDMPYTEKVSI